MKLHILRPVSAAAQQETTRETSYDLGRLRFSAAFAVFAMLAAAPPAGAQDALVTYKSLSPEIALDLARATLEECRKRGFQVAVAVVDRFGQTQVMIRDRFAGPHTPGDRGPARAGPPSASVPTPPIWSGSASRGCRRPVFATCRVR